MTTAAPLSARAEATTRRTYNRPLDDAGSVFETWGQTVRRAQYEHQQYLWETAGGTPDPAELAELEALGLSRAALVAGRTLWLGGTPYGRDRACSNFNCSALELTTVYDMVDAFWLLLNGAGVGALPRAGTLQGYRRPMPLSVIPSTRAADFKGPPANREERPSAGNDFTWTIRVGDSAEAWAKALGKMLVPPGGRCDRLVLDGSNCRGPGGRLKGYGWICNGFPPLAEALAGVHAILNRRAGDLLTVEDVGDVFNFCGQVLSTRRAAEILLLDEYHPEAAAFARRKHEYWDGNNQRRQSNNSLLFWRRPSVDDLVDLLKMNLVGGEPGFVNAVAALRKAPWFRLLNPCVPAGTPILTRRGSVPIESAAGTEVEVWNGGQWSAVTPLVTGYDQSLVRVTLTDGRALTCTPAHRFPVLDASTPGNRECMTPASSLRPGTLLVNHPLPDSPPRTPGATYFVGVRSVEPAGRADVVYCFREPLAGRGTFGGIVTGQCGEVLLGSCSFCNLVSVDLPSFGRDYGALERAVYLAARANYRQTCVDLRDGVLQPRWHQTNESLRLCGVSLTGVVNADWLSDYEIRRLRNAAVCGAYSQADRLGLPRPKAVTLIKPEGTRTKITGTVRMERGEGVHRPPGRHVFNWINFSHADPLVGALAAAGYATLPNPSDPANVLVRFPVDYAGCDFTTLRGADGSARHVNLEPATAQLARYLRWNRLWADHNVSATISFDEAEVPALARMIYDNWDSGYIATAFLRRADPTLTAADLGHPYLPQEVVTEGAYREATAGLKKVDWDRYHRGVHEISDAAGECAGGVCPVK